MHLRFYHWAKGNALCLDSPCPWAWPPMSSRIKGTWGWSVCPWHGLRRCIRPHMQQSCCITHHNTNHGHVFSCSRACLWVGLGHVAWLQVAGPAQLRCMAHPGAQGSSRLGLAVLATLQMCKETGGGDSMQAQPGKQDSRLCSPHPHRPSKSHDPIHCQEAQGGATSPIMRGLARSHYMAMKNWGQNFNVPKKEGRVPVVA